MPQPPQWLGSPAVLTSHPSLGMPLQSMNPKSQAAMPQTPATQAEMALAAAQTWPQAPQLLVSVKTFTSQPSLTEPLQFANPLLQIMEPLQTPLLHVAPTALGTLQAVPSGAGGFEQPVVGSHVPA